LCYGRVREKSPESYPMATAEEDYERVASGWPDVILLLLDDYTALASLADAVGSDPLFNAAVFKVTLIFSST